MKQSAKIYESNIVKAVLRYLNKLPGCYAEKTWGGMMGNRGRPDITGCLNGRRLELEVKTPSGRLTPNQAAYLEKWNRAGAVTGVVTGVADTEMLLVEHKLLKVDSIYEVRESKGDS